MPLENFPEVFLSSEAIKKQVTRELHKGTIRKIGPRLYTKNIKDSPEYIVKKHIWSIASLYFLDGLVADRTAMENAPTPDGSIFLISKRKRDVVLPGYILKPRTGIPALESDYPFIGNLKICSQARAFLENMKPSRGRQGRASRTLSQKEIEERLDSIIRGGGENAINKLRDKAKQLAPKLGLQKECLKLEKQIGALLGTKETVFLSDVTKARQKGKPYDPYRVELFHKLYTDLKNTPPQSRICGNFSQEARVNLAFFEAYFSNFIEGTEFAVEEATEIIFLGRISPERPEDAHDILGTYQVVSSLDEMSEAYNSFEEFIDILKNRHQKVMSSRADKKPGIFKDKINRAGNTVFVGPELVLGTLLKGYELLRSLETPFSRAVFVMFIIAEIHPFLDGNGRVARIMMNGELVKNKEYSIIIPTIYRNNYLSALKALSQNEVTDPLIRVLNFAQRYTVSIDWSDFKRAWKQLEETNAFYDPYEADMEGIRLKLNI